MPSNPKYGRKHQALKDQELTRLQPGTLCPQIVAGQRCDQPMYPEQDLDLGHADDGSYIGLVHRTCNRRAGQERSTAARRAAVPQRPCAQCRRTFKPRTRKITRCDDCQQATPPHPSNPPASNGSHPPAPIGHHW